MSAATRLETSHAEMTPTFRLDGGVALVTGAAGGIGAAIAAGLADAGADVGCLDLAGAGLERTAAAVRDRGRGALALSGDVTDPDALDACVEEVERELGPLTLAVNCAGVHSAAAAEDMDLDTWQRLIDVNLTGVFGSCRAEGRAMIRGGGGAIVNIGSIAATIACRGLEQIHYNATKSAVVSLSRSLALEWADRGIRVNTLSPGYVKTALTRGPRTTRTLADYLGDIPMGRFAEPTEMIGPTVFLLSAAASYCTGAELVVDGGAISW